MFHGAIKKYNWHVLVYRGVEGNTVFA